MSIFIYIPSFKSQHWAFHRCSILNGPNERIDHYANPIMLSLHRQSQYEMLLNDTDSHLRSADIHCHRQRNLNSVSAPERSLSSHWVRATNSQSKSYSLRSLLIHRERPQTQTPEPDMYSDQNMDRIWKYRVMFSTWFSNTTYLIQESQRNGNVFQPRDHCGIPSLVLIKSTKMVWNRFIKWFESERYLKRLNSGQISNQSDEIGDSDINRGEHHDVVHMEEIRKCPDPFIVQKILVQDEEHRDRDHQTGDIRHELILYGMKCVARRFDDHCFE